MNFTSMKQFIFIARWIERKRSARVTRRELLRIKGYIAFIREYFSWWIPTPWFVAQRTRQNLKLYLLLISHLKEIIYVFMISCPMTMTNDNDLYLLIYISLIPSFFVINLNKTPFFTIIRQTSNFDIKVIIKITF